MATVTGALPATSASDISALQKGRLQTIENIIDFTTEPGQQEDELLQDDGTVLVVNDVINVFRIPAGVKVIDTAVDVLTLGSVAGAKIDVGSGSGAPTDDPNGWDDGIGIGSGDSLGLHSTSSSDAFSMTTVAGQLYTDEDTLDIVITDALPTGAKIRVMAIVVMYGRD